MRCFSVIVFVIALLMVFMACNSKSDGLEAGCHTINKGETLNEVKSQEIRMLSSGQEFITCNEIDQSYEGRGYNIASFDAFFKSKVRLKLVEDGTAPDWAPKTITATGIIGCEYDAKSEAITTCMKNPPWLYYGAAEPEIKRMPLQSPKEPYPHFPVALVNGKTLIIIFDVEPGKHSAHMPSDSTYFYYTNQDSTDDSDVQPDAAVQQDADTATDAEITD